MIIRVSHRHGSTELKQLHHDGHDKKPIQFSLYYANYFRCNVTERRSRNPQQTIVFFKELIAFLAMPNSSFRRYSYVSSAVFRFGFSISSTPNLPRTEIARYVIPLFFRGARCSLRRSRYRSINGRCMSRV